MEPFSALAVATSVVQFVDFGSKLISRAVKIYNSDADVPYEFVDINSLHKNMRSIGRELETTLSSSPETGLQVHEREILDICRQCESISVELTASFDKIQAQGKPTTWDSFRRAFRSMIGQPKLESFQRQLEELRQQLVLSILVSLRYEALAECVYLASY
jgi:hypothetical protein